MLNWLRGLPGSPTKQVPPKPEDPDVIDKLLSCCLDLLPYAPTKFCISDHAQNLAGVMTQHRGWHAPMMRSVMAFLKNAGFHLMTVDGVQVMTDFQIVAELKGDVWRIGSHVSLDQINFRTSNRKDSSQNAYLIEQNGEYRIDPVDKSLRSYKEWLRLNPTRK